MHAINGNGNSLTLNVVIAVRDVLRMILAVNDGIDEAKDEFVSNGNKRLSGLSTPWPLHAQQSAVDVVTLTIAEHRLEGLTRPPPRLNTGLGDALLMRQSVQVTIHSVTAGCAAAWRSRPAELFFLFADASGGAITIGTARCGSALHCIQQKRPKAASVFSIWMSRNFTESKVLACLALVARFIQSDG